MDVEIKKKSLLRQLKLTVLGLSIAMLAMWLLFYVNMHRMIQQYVLDNMQQVAVQIMNELNRSFLQIEEVSFELSENENVLDFIQTEDSLDFYTKAGELNRVMEQLPKDSSFMNNIIIYNNTGMYYRFAGNISNTGARRMMTMINRENITRYLKLRLDDVNYIGFVTDIMRDGVSQGKIVMLTDEKDIYQLFGQVTDYDKMIASEMQHWEKLRFSGWLEKQAGKYEEMGILLAAEGEVIVSNQDEMRGKRTETFAGKSRYQLQSQVGFTPFELFIIYEDTDARISFLFLIVMLIMAVILFAILEAFLHFWKKKFFAPIQTVISEVEDFESGKGDKLPLTGLEHFDGLVSGINDMVERIEQKEKEIYQTTYSLQKAELKKQKALIISLKKQISAHFTVNVLTIIKALSAEGEGEKAGLLCDGLSFLLRYANAGDSYISGMDEFFVLDKYVEIMKIRYPDRFDAEIDYEDELENIELPRMLIQPVIENSIIHGLLHITDGRKGIVHVFSRIEQDSFKIIVEDNGNGIKKDALIELRNNLSEASEDEVEVEVEGLSHVALINIERRIRSYFGAEYGMSVESTENVGTRVTLHLPVRRRGLP